MLPPLFPGHNVSIHAPVRGATVLFRDMLQDDPVSIHAPVRGATRLEVSQDKVIRVSIHAPVRGATSTFSRAWFCWERFNPRPRAGGDAGGKQPDNHD